MPRNLDMPRPNDGAPVSSSRRLLALLLVGACCELACSASARPSGDAQVALDCFVGDPAAAPEIEIVYRTADGSPQQAMHGGTLPLIQPPQGGKVMFVSVRARNLDGCPLALSTALIDPEDGYVISLERRTIDMEQTPDGWLQPREQTQEISNYSNLPACPRAGLSRSVHGETYHLRAAVEDAAGRMAEQEIAIVPACGEPDRLQQCELECSKDYVLGARGEQP